MCKTSPYYEIYFGKLKKKTVGALLVMTLKDGKQMKEAGRANKTRCNGVIFRAGKPICKQMSCKLKCSTTICCQTLGKNLGLRFKKKLVDNKRDYIDSMINQNIDKNRFLTEKDQCFLWARFNLIFFPKALFPK